MWPRKELINLLDISHPISRAPMAAASTPELIAAVSNAGGLGSYGAAATPPDQLRQIIRRIRKVTDRPFGINLFAPTTEPGELTPERQNAMSQILARYHSELDAGPVPEPVPMIGPFEASSRSCLRRTSPSSASTLALPRLTRFARCARGVPPYWRRRPQFKRREYWSRAGSVR